METDPGHFFVAGCNSSEARLRDCDSFEQKNSDCGGGGAGVRCREEQLRVKNISAATISIPEYYDTMNTVLISWELYSNASHKPSSFTIVCFNQQHRNISELSISYNNGTLTQISVGVLLPSTSYNCCVSPIYYYGEYTAERKCSLTNSEILQADSFIIPTSTELEKFVDISSHSNIIGGVLGSIMIILLLLLTACGGALLYMLRSKGVFLKR